MRDTTVDTRNITRNVVRVGVLAAIAFMLMFIKVPLAFIAPSFMSLDLSDVPALIGGFAMGPVYGVSIQLIKNLLKLPTSSTGGVGPLSNFIVGGSFVLVSSLIYKKHKTLKRADIGLFFGILTMSALAMASNYYIIYPLYSRIMIPMEQLIAMGTAISPRINSLETMIVFSILPFNLIKGTINALVTRLIYKRVRKYL